MARILIVEDELRLRRVIALNLVHHGHSVAEADSVATATEACMVSPESFDLILLDIDLPDGTGWDILRQFRADNSAVATPANESKRSYPPVIVMTALRPAPSRIETFQPVAVLLKPFPITALLQLIERALARSNAKATQNDDYSEEEAGA